MCVCVPVAGSAKQPMSSGGCVRAGSIRMGTSDVIDIKANRKENICESPHTRREGGGGEQQPSATKKTPAHRLNLIKVFIYAAMILLTNDLT